MRQTLSAYALSEGLVYDITSHEGYTEAQRIKAFRAWKCVVATHADSEGCDLVDEHGQPMSPLEACDCIKAGRVVEVVT